MPGGSRILGAPAWDMQFRSNRLRDRPHCHFGWRSHSKLQREEEEEEEREEEERRTTVSERATAPRSHSRSRDRVLARDELLRFPSRSMVARLRRLRKINDAAHPVGQTDGQLRHSLRHARRTSCASRVDDQHEQVRTSCVPPGTTSSRSSVPYTQTPNPEDLSVPYRTFVSVSSRMVRYHTVHSSSYDANQLSICRFGRAPSTSLRLGSVMVLATPWSWYPEPPTKHQAEPEEGIAERRPALALRLRG